MDVVINLDSLGFGIPRTGFGLNLISGSYIQVSNPAKRKPDIFGLTDVLSLGDNSSTMVFASLKTSPIKLSTAEEIQSFTMSGLVAQKIQINIDGTLIGNGKADVTITRIDGDGRPTELLKRFDVKVSGGQLARTSIRGNVRKLP
ncbi:hypothetical protein [Marinobacter sp.]|uniref:hypothetical protein n=1 Tax=Marinobacter sp. TaxID=50741 RepID=UPI0038504F22